MLTYSSNYFDGTKHLIRFAHLLEKSEGGGEEEIDLRADFFGEEMYDSNVHKIELFSLSLLSKLGDFDKKQRVLKIKPMEVVTLVVELKNLKQEAARKQQEEEAMLANLAFYL